MGACLKKKSRFALERRIRSEVVSDFGTWLRGIHFVSLFAHLSHSTTKERPSQGYTFKKVWTRNDKLSGFICGRSFEGNQLFKVPLRTSWPVTVVQHVPVLQPNHLPNISFRVMRLELLLFLSLMMSPMR